jgi:nucleotide-binding universal stress UspA family protein
MSMITVLLPVDGSASSTRAVQMVANWYPRLAPLEVRLLYVQVGNSVPSTALDEPTGNGPLETGHRVLESAAAILARAGVPCSSDVRSGYVPAVIVQCAKLTNCDGIVMGTRGMGSSDEVLGSIARQVINFSNLPVTLVK